MLRRNCFLRHVIGGKIEGGLEVTRRRERRLSRYWMTLGKQDYWKLKEVALGRTLWRRRCGGGCLSVVKTDCNERTEIRFYRDGVLMRHALCTCEVGIKRLVLSILFIFAFCLQYQKIPSGILCVTPTPQKLRFRSSLGSTVSLAPCVCA